MERGLRSKLPVCDDAMLFIGYCKECANEVYERDMIPDYKDIYECSKCGYPHSKDELWDEIPSYLEGVTK